MSTLLFIALALHVLAAVSWIGGMVFLSWVFVPLLRRSEPTSGSAVIFRAAARRFRFLVWLAIAVLLTTGPVLLHARGWTITDPSRWPSTLSIKLIFVCALLTLTFLHELVPGPRIKHGALITANEMPLREGILPILASWIPRLALMLSLAVVVAALSLSRA